MDLLFLDTETTGNDLKTDRLCQVCFKIPSGIYCEYFKPPIPISVKSMSITHITNKMISDKPVFAGSKMSKTLKSLLAKYILIAHNAKFDIEMLKAEGLEVPQSICTLRVARYLDQQNVIPEYNLQYLRYYLELEVEANAHDATSDVLVLEAIFNRLYQKMLTLHSTHDLVINKMIEISAHPSLFHKFNFGKYKDKTVAEVAIADKEYLLWLLNQKLLNNQDDEDWIFTLQHYTNN